MPDMKGLRAPITVLASGLLVSVSFLMNGGRTEWYMLKLLYRLFGDLVLSESGFLFAGMILYFLLWFYLSATIYLLLRAFKNQTEFYGTLNSVSEGFFLPQLLVFPFGLFSNYYIHIVGIIVFGLLLPLSLTPFTIKKASNADFYRRTLSFMLSIYLLLLFWTNVFEPLGVI
ncbi:hypothetical protein [Archaeoglobus sp.]